ncbi:MAG: trypsin-like peptidase domain-containing protein [Bacteroidota bacterium]|nr:trypsin-like peptidase domain-containing protein [Bacteroidota bacterium]
MMEDILLLQAIERYLDGTMLPAERAYFEQLRKNTPEIDQMVVEHSMFLHQIDMYADKSNMKHLLNETHAKLLAIGDINEGGELPLKGKVIQMWNRYRRDIAIAASVGGAIALMISALVAYLSPVNNYSQIQQLKGEIEYVKNKQKDQFNKLSDVESKLPKDFVFKGSGSGFLIDPKGYIVTNAHVLKGSSYANVINNGEEYTAKIVYNDDSKDLAILKIDDHDFKPLKSLPYSLRKNNVDLGEEIYTLGYPRNEIVSNIGYLSARSGFNGDTSSFQIQMSANPGNSGGPVLNKNGEIIGILSTKEKQVEGVAFAIKTKTLYKFLDELKKTDSPVETIKVPSRSLMKGLDRVAQIKQMESCVFLVQAFNKK